MHDATQIRPAAAGALLAAGPAIDPDRIEPGWSPPGARLALSWNEVAAGWLAACGLLAILGVAAIIGHEPMGDPVYRSVGMPGSGPATGTELCQAVTPAQSANPFILAPRPQGHA
jgi:hypothetical protein